MSANLLRTVFVLAVLLQGAIASSAQTEELLRTERIDMRPTLIGDTRHQSVAIPVRALPPGDYRVIQNLRAPFFLEADSSDLRTVNGEIVIAVSFSPVVVGFFNDAIELVRDPQIAPFDTVRIRVTGNAFRIERRVVLDYGDVVLGDTSVRAVPIAANLADNEEWLESRQVSLPYTHLTSDGPVGTGDTLAFLFRFQPLRTGEFLDSIGLIRRGSGVNLDTIQVYLRGRGVRQSLNLSVRFAPTITGDSVERRRAFRPPPGAERRFKVDHVPAPPFNALFEGNIQPHVTDSVFVAVAYMPSKPGAHADSLVLIRLDKDDQPFDTVRVALSGTARGLQARDSVSFVDVIVGEPMSTEQTLTLPIEPVNKDFSYDVEPSSVGPFTASVLEPQFPSKDTSITIKVTANPNVFGDVEEEIDLVRSSSSGRDIDRTRIIVRMKMKPRPASVTLAWSADTMSYNVGDTAELDIIMELEGDPDKLLRVTQLNASIQYNPTVFVPLAQEGQERVVEEGGVVWTIEQSYDPPLQITQTRTVIATLRGVVVLGDASSTSLPIVNSISFEDEAPREVESRPGTLVVTDIWVHGGGPRLVNPFTGDLVLEVAPNPVVTSSIVSVDNVPDGAGFLVVYDATGEAAFDFSEDLRGGQREWIVSSGTQSATSLAPGSYYVRLIVNNPDTGVMNSVVRLFIVQ